MSFNGFHETKERPESQGSGSAAESLPEKYLDTTVDENVTEFTDIVGGYGPWQRNIFVLLFLASIPSTWHNLMMTFMAPDMDHWCSRPLDLKSNTTIKQWQNLTTPPGTDPNHQCAIIPFWNSTNQTLECSSWEYNTSFYQSTIVNEWDLVCDRQWLVSLTIALYNVGYLVSVLIFGQLSDTIGRRPVLLICYVINVSAGVLSAFSTSYAMFAVLRFFIALGGAGFYNISFVLLMEIVSPVNRPMVGISINFGWSLAFISLPGVAWLVRDWFWLQLTVTLPKLIFFCVFWVIPESPRWLLIHDKQEKLLTTLTAAAKKNGKADEDIDANLNKLFTRAEMDNKKITAKRATVFDLLKTPELRKKTLNLYYNWLVNSFIYFGLSYNTNDLTGDMYLSFFASGAVEFPAYIVTIYIIKRMGRRIPLTTAMIIGGVACAITIPIPDSLLWLKVTIALLGKFCITATFATVYIYSAEIFPTVVRNAGVGSAATIGRIGSVVAPFVRELETATHPAVPQAIYSALSISSGALILFLPETNNTKFPDTLEEAESFGKKTKRAYGLHHVQGKEEDTRKKKDDSI